MTSFADRTAQAAAALRTIFPETPLQENDYLSRKTGARILLKREDLSPVRSYKIRGAFNFFRQALAAGTDAELFVCASAGNHAQGFAFVCRHFGKKGVVFMPVTTPQQKIDKTRHLRRRVRRDHGWSAISSTIATAPRSNFCRGKRRPHGAAFRPQGHHRGAGDGRLRDRRPDAGRPHARHHGAAGRRRRAFGRRDALFPGAGARAALRLLRAGRRAEPEAEPRARQARASSPRSTISSTARRSPRSAASRSAISRIFRRTTVRLIPENRALRDDDRHAQCRRRGAGAGRRAGDRCAQGFSEEGNQGQDDRAGGLGRQFRLRAAARREGEGAALSKG